MKNVLTTLLVVVIGATIVLAVYLLVRAAGPSPTQTTSNLKAGVSAEGGSELPTPAAPPANPWSKSLNVSPRDAASIAGAIASAFDENQLRRRVILSLWSEGHNADTIAVLTGYRVSTVLDAMRNYRSNVTRRRQDITTYAAKQPKSEIEKIGYRYEVTSAGTEDKIVIDADEVRPGKAETSFFLAGDLVAEFQNSNMIGWVRKPAE